jgi:hypothetical protein
MFIVTTIKEIRRFYGSCIFIIILYYFIPRNHQHILSIYCAMKTLVIIIIIIIIIIQFNLIFLCYYAETSR